MSTLKTTNLFRFGLIVFFLGFFIAGQGFTFTNTKTAPVLEEDQGRWVKLGQRRVDRKLDRDVIMVTAQEGRFSKLKFRVRRTGINMHKVVVHFGNGEKQEIALRRNMAANSETRVIDLRGGQRVIKKIVFWYDTKGVYRAKGILAAWGRR